VVVGLYHVKVAEPRFTPPRIYTVDIDALDQQVKNKALSQISNGEKLDLDRLIEEVREDLQAEIETLPPRAVVLDAKVVVSGADGRIE